MKKFIAFTAILSFLVSCGGSSDKGELVGVKGKKWHPEKPFGMTLVPGGAFIMGRSSDDQANSQDANTKTVTVRSFYMDETEISNSEYRQFVEWVKDSTIRVRLANLAEEEVKKLLPMVKVLVKQEVLEILLTIIRILPKIQKRQLMINTCMINTLLWMKKI